MPEDEPAANLWAVESGIIPAAMRVHTATLSAGISRTKEFEKKGLAQFAVNVGTKCGHGCLYCSTGAMLRMHPSFKAVGESPFESGYAIVDPGTPERVARDATKIKSRGLIQLCTTVDAWSPEAQEHDLGRRCLEAVLSQPGWTVRILTKNAASNAFDLIERYRERVLVGLSLTATGDKSRIMSVVEPHASPNSERMKTLDVAHRRGLRTYGMLCPLLPGVSDSPGDVDRLVNFVLDCGAEEVFVEPVNGRGPCLGDTEEALRTAGFRAEADASAAVRHGVGWSAYTTRLLRSVQDALRRRRSLHKLRFLLYPSKLTERDAAWIRSHSEGVKWLGKNRAEAACTGAARQKGCWSGTARGRGSGAGHAPESGGAQ
jgi:DNA repair photolyase